MRPNSPDRTIRALFTIIALLLVAPLTSSAQTMDLQLGTSFSHLKSNIGGSPYTFLGKNRIDPAAFIGFEYLEHKYWSISGNIGYVRKGGKEPWETVDSAGNVTSKSTASEVFDYLSINTTFNFKYPIKDNWCPYVSVGPRIDFMVNHDHTFQYFDYFLVKRSYGLVAAVGLRYSFPTFVLGIRAEHLYNFNYLASDGFEKNYTETSVISLTIGSRFRSHKKAAAPKAPQQ